MSDNAPLSIHELVAYLVVNCNVAVSLGELTNLSLHDPLYPALLKAYQLRKEVEDRRTALICATIANCMAGGSKRKFEVDDFMPKQRRGQTEEETKAKLLEYNKAIQQAIKR